MFEYFALLSDESARKVKAFVDAYIEAYNVPNQMYHCSYVESEFRQFSRHNVQGQTDVDGYKQPSVFMTLLGVPDGADLAQALSDEYGATVYRFYSNTSSSYYPQT